MKSLRYIFLFGIVLLLFSCNKFSGSQEIPAYLRIEPWDFSIPNNDYDHYGAATQNITDAWLYVNGSFQGCYEMKKHEDGVYAQIPVLEEGRKKLTFYPGIKMNGISSTRIQYPFYKSDTMTYDFVQQEIGTIHPRTSYYNIDSTVLTFKLMEDFENANNIQLFRLDTTYAELNIINHDVDTNAWTDNIHKNSGHFHLADSTLRFAVATGELTGLPHNGRSYVLMELDYKCSSDFLIGMYIKSSLDGIMDKDLYYLRATDVWKKAYINFTPTIIENYNAVYFKIYFKGAVLEGETGDFYFDNIKLIHN